MATVHYNRKTVSDENIKSVLQKIADFFGKDVSVTSGDRTSVVKGSSKKSHHIQKRAADFHVKGITDRNAFVKLKLNSAKIFDADKRYQVIRHGNFTSTGGPHLHIGRYLSGKGAAFYLEGTTKETKGKYVKQ